eukprot:191131_1
MAHLFLLYFSLSFAVNLCIKDWLIHPPQSFPNVTFKRGNINDLDTYILSNGLISRTFVSTPNFATIAYDSYLNGNEATKSSILRTLSPESIIGINGISYNIGGIHFKSTSKTNTASPNTAYMDPQWLTSSNLDTNTLSSFIFNGKITTTTISKPYEWTPGTRHSPKYIHWPPLGLAIETHFIPSTQIHNISYDIAKYITICIRYELYQGMPILSKSLSIISSNPSVTSSLFITGITVETLAVNVPYSPGSNADAINSCTPYTNTYGMSPYSNMISYSGGLFLKTDQAHGTQVKWYNDVNMPNISGSYQPNVAVQYASPGTEWAVRLAPNVPGTYNGTLHSFRVLEIVLDIHKDLGNLERTGLARRRMKKYLTPATTENPIYAASVESSMTNDTFLRSFIDQCEQVGFEMLIFSFGSGFHMEDTSPQTLEFYANIIEYAASKNIEIGGYDLIMADRYVENGQYQVIDANGKKENNVCFGSKWVDMVTKDFDAYIDIGMRNVITDGPFGGEVCHSTTHEYHENANDSVFRQMYLQNKFYVDMKNAGVYIHQPDEYYYYGGSKSGMGYNEQQYSLPRWLDLAVSRMGMYDDTYINLVTSGWMFMPLTAYHSSDPDCYFEPLSEHIDEYNWALGQYFGFGVMPMMRGTQLYDSEQVKKTVMKWTDFYHKHRDILTSDIIHLRRCDMQSFDAILHANAFLAREKGLVMIYNPTNYSIDTNFTFSLYYTGISSNVLVSHNDGPYVRYALEKLYEVTLSLSLEPLSIQYYLLNPL